jgi:hypothetical protein
MPIAAAGRRLLDLLSGNVGAIFNPVANLVAHVRPESCACWPSRVAAASRCCPTCRPCTRRDARLPRDRLGRPVRSRGARRGRSSIGCMAPCRRAGPTTSNGAGRAGRQGRAREPRRLQRFVGREIERWMRIAKATEIDMD